MVKEIRVQYRRKLVKSKSFIDAVNPQFISLYITIISLSVNDRLEKMTTLSTRFVQDVFYFLFTKLLVLVLVEFLHLFCLEFFKWLTRLYKIKDKDSKTQYIATLLKLFKFNNVKAGCKGVKSKEMGDHLRKHTDVLKSNKLNIFSSNSYI